MSTSQRRRRTQGDSGIDVNDFSQRRARYLGAFAYYSDHGDRVVEAETAVGEGRKRPARLFTLAGDGPLTKGGGARFFGLARGSSS